VGHLSQLQAQNVTIVHQHLVDNVNTNSLQTSNPQLAAVLTFEL